MKIQYKNKLKYKVVDFIDQSPWFAVAFMFVATALSAIWIMGFLTLLLAK